ncbi:MAG: YbhB/YbcL family Raf kinase inhibitor-like protein [Neisseria sp.]|uniref:YbhB/YbcL family Raf kinase inhibitor-like protein n=1 Tax=Neisseria sp. TaxID=192066 RepID=UPI0026DD0EEF|nr:YbhB/YbcL family Raf kinase inhibitor-like protein [Neisseria sp.]MDO4642191.1 YbhB/YbcL family Raf kinase inhibitor-like protein [Neisseria sp.]
MNKLIYTATVLALCFSGQAGAAPTLQVRQPQTAQKQMTLASADIRPKAKFKAAQVANSFGCSGQNISPELHWSNVPAGTKSFVVTMYDPDAPTGSGFWHWNVYNIPADTRKLAQGAANQLPAGAKMLKNDAGEAGYIGACPPAGDKAHRYIFTVYALNTTLDLPDGTSPAVLGFNLNGKVLGQAQLTGFYGR